MKQKIMLSPKEIKTIVDELEVASNSTDDYNYAMQLSNLIKKLRGNEGTKFYSKTPNRPLEPLNAQA